MGGQSRYQFSSVEYWSVINTNICSSSTSKSGMRADMSASCRAASELAWSEVQVSGEQWDMSIRIECFKSRIYPLKLLHSSPIGICLLLVFVQRKIPLGQELGDLGPCPSSTPNKLCDLKKSLTSLTPFAKGGGWTRCSFESFQFQHSKSLNTWNHKPGLGIK